MGHNILYTKNSKLCIKKMKYQATQVLKEVLEPVTVKKQILTLESVVMALLGHKA